MDLDYILGYLIGLGTILFTGKSLLRGLEYAANADAPNQIPDLGNILEGLRRGSYTGGQANTWMSQMGFDQDVIDGLILNYESLLGAGDAIVALYRGTISQDTFTTTLSKLGLSASTIATMRSNFETRVGASDLIEAEHRALILPPEIGTTEQEVYGQGMTAGRLALYRQLALRVPALADLFTFASWGVEDPAQVAAGGLDQGKPADYYKRALAAGYDAPTADLFWASHWTPPPVFILHTLFQTGQLSESDLSYFLAVAQHPPGFIPKIVKAFYKQLSETQIVASLQNGSIQESDVDNLLKNNGYSPDVIPLLHQDVMLKASLPSTEEKAAQAAQRQQFKSLSVGNVMSSYEEGIIDKDEVNTLLTDLQIQPDIITFQLNHSDWKVQNKQLTDNITSIGDQFQLGLIDQSAATSALAALGVSAVKQQNLIYKWLKIVPAKVKLLSEVELMKAFKAQLIDMATLNTRLQALGYSANDALLLIALEGSISLAQAQLALAEAQVSGTIIP